MGLKEAKQENRKKAALAPDCGHVLGEVSGWGYNLRRSRFFRFRHLACRNRDRPFSELVGIAWPLSLADCHTQHHATRRMLKRHLWKSKQTHYRSSVFVANLEED